MKGPETLYHLIIFWLSFTPFIAKAQSIRPPELGPQLVVNNGFEDIKRIPTKWYYNGEDFNLIMNKWVSPTLSSPDVYTPSTKVPEGWAEKGFGDARPYKGRNMVGLTLYGCEHGKPHCREYIQSMLKEPLIIGQKYYIDFWVKPLKKSMLCNNIGAFFSVFEIKKELDVQLKCKPQLNARDIIRPDKNEWIHIEGIFTASTAAKYIVLGNFFADDKTKTMLPGGKDPLNFAYYYFDEISVYKIPPFTEAPSEEGTFDACCIKKGDTIQLHNIYFDFDKSVLRPESYIELNKLLRVLGDRPSMKVHITGHTDIIGRSNYNIWLSRNRANAVREFLIENAVDEDRLKVVAMSYSQPAATNKTEEGRQLNRRVELIVIEE